MLDLNEKERKVLNRLMSAKGYLDYMISDILATNCICSPKTPIKSIQENLNDAIRIYDATWK